MNNSSSKFQICHYTPIFLVLRLVYNFPTFLPIILVMMLHYLPDHTTTPKIELYSPWHASFLIPVSHVII